MLPIDLRWYMYGIHVDINVDKKTLYNQNTFTGLEFSNFSIFDQNTCFKNFWKGQYFKSPQMDSNS